MTLTTIGGRFRRMLHAIARAYTASTPYYLHSLAVGPVFVAADRRTTP